jgi:hypothetical protein
MRHRIHTPYTGDVNVQASDADPDDFGPDPGTNFNVKKVFVQKSFKMLFKD